IWIAGLREQLARLHGIVSIRRRWPREFKSRRDDACRRSGEAESLRLIDGVAVDRHRCGQAHAAVVPGPFRIPLLWPTVEPFGADQGRGELQSRRTLHRFGERAAE